MEPALAVVPKATLTKVRILLAYLAIQVASHALTPQQLAASLATAAVSYKMVCVYSVIHHARHALETQITAPIVQKDPICWVQAAF